MCSIHANITYIETCLKKWSIKGYMELWKNTYIHKIFDMFDENSKKNSVNS
jgi:hypothetical protein